MVVLIDELKEPGIINSPKVLEVLEFLESCAGAPEGALAVLFPHYQQALRVLRGSGYVRRCWKPGKEPFWCPPGKPFPDDSSYVARCALGWLAARLYEAGAKLEGRYAVFQNNYKLKVYVVPPLPIKQKENGLAVLLSNDNEEIPRGWYYVEYQRLKKKLIKECLNKKGG